MSEWFAKFGDHLPPALKAQHEALGGRVAAQPETWAPDQA